MKSRILKSEERNAFAKILKSDIEARKIYKWIMKAGITNLRFDHKLVKNDDGSYSEVPDLEVWNCNLHGIHVCIIKRDETWTPHS